MIKIDSERAKKLQFTSDRFTWASYLWEESGYVCISSIISKEQRKGYLEDLCRNIWNEGLKVKIPTPSKLMRRFLNKHQFEQTWDEYEHNGDGVEVWIK